MNLNAVLPPPDQIQQRLQVVRKERDLLKRLYRLSLDARAVDGLTDPLLVELARQPNRESVQGASDAS